MRSLCSDDAKLGMLSLCKNDALLAGRDRLSLCLEVGLAAMAGMGCTLLELFGSHEKLLAGPA